MDERYYNLLGNYNNLEKRRREILDKVNKLASEIGTVEESVSFLFSFSEHNTSMIKDKLERLTNLALRTIFPDKAMMFKVCPKKTKKGLFYDLFIETNSMITPIHDAKGGGVLDVISMCLRISYLCLMKSQLRPTLLLDEPFKNLDSERLPLAIEWLRSISKQLSIQLLIVTHIPALISSVDKSFQMTLEDGFVLVN